MWLGVVGCNCKLLNHINNQFFTILKYTNCWNWRLYAREMNSTQGNFTWFGFIKPTFTGNYMGIFIHNYKMKKITMGITNGMKNNTHARNLITRLEL